MSVPNPGKHLFQPILNGLSRGVSLRPSSNTLLGPAIFSPCLRHILRLLAPKNDHEQRPRRACAVRIQEEGIINTEGQGRMGEEESPRVCKDTRGRW